MMLHLAGLCLCLSAISSVRAVLDTFQCPVDGRVRPNSRVEAEVTLRNCLTANYSINVRPSQSTRDVTRVKTRVERIIVSQMLDKEDYLSLDVYVTYSWNDYRLVWDATANAGITFIYYKPWRLWTPEIILNDGRAETGKLVTYERALVTSTGDITWAPQLRANAYCDGDYSKFPYDTQRCKFSFQRQLYQKETVNVEVLNGLRMGEDVCSSIDNEWTVVKCDAYLENVTIGAEVSQTLQLDVSVRRNYHYHQNVIVLPSIILALLILSLYWVPHDSHQRFALAGGLLFATLMANLLLQNFLPLGISQIPVVVCYLLYIIIMLIITTIISLFTQNIASVDPATHSVPALLRKTLLNGLTCKLAAVFNTEAHIEQPITSFENTTWQRTSAKTTTPSNNNDKVIHSICKQLDVLSQTSSSSSSIDNPWKQLSLVIDRLFFFVFFFIFIIVTSVLYSH